MSSISVVAKWVNVSEVFTSMKWNWWGNLFMLSVRTGRGHVAK
jgi:hypothetical protein